MIRGLCPHCKRQRVNAAGPEDASILLMGEFPGHNEVIRGYPFVTRTGKGTTSGDVLFTELMLAGIQMFACRATNLWQHEKDEKTCDLNWHVDTALREVAGRKIVICLGSDVSKALFKVPIMEVSGLVLEHRAYPGTKFLMSPNPAVVLHGPIGEIRNALSVLPTLIEGD